MTIEQAKSELMQIYGMLSPDKQRAIDTLLHTIEQDPSNVREHDKDHIWYKGKQYISLNRFLQVKEPCDKCVYSTKDGCCQYDDITETIPPFEPSGDMVSRGVYEQVKWERDVAIEQLKELGYGLGEEPKIGHWIPTYGNVMCSVCGNVKDSGKVGKATHYCDFCGAKMESKDKE